MRENKIASITGASRLNGIGAAICHLLADNGFDIFFTVNSGLEIAQDDHHIQQIGGAGKFMGITGNPESTIVGS